MKANVHEFIVFLISYFQPAAYVSASRWRSARSDRERHRYAPPVPTTLPLRRGFSGNRQYPGNKLI
jgi:hypothetical protein